MTKDEVNKIVQYTKEYYKYSLQNDRYTIERYVDYSDKFPEEAISRILRADNPRDCFYNTIDEWDINCDDWLYETEFFDGLAKLCKENDIDEDEARDVVFENFQWTYPEDFLNPEFNAVIQLDTGDGNYDFTMHNILNYAKNYGSCDGLEKIAGLHWLAKQQGRLGLLKREINSSRYSDEKCSESPFVESSITELENLCTNMSAVTFLVKMHLMDAINILQKIRENIDNFNPYQPLDTSGCPFGYIVLSKDTVTGLYDSWQGSGSLMEINLEKDVKIPIHLINSIDTDNNFQDVYGVIDDCWKETLLKIA